TYRPTSLATSLASDSIEHVFDCKLTPDRRRSCSQRPGLRTRHGSSRSDDRTRDHERVRRCRIRPRNDSVARDAHATRGVSPPLSRCVIKRPQHSGHMARPTVRLTGNTGTPIRKPTGLPVNRGDAAPACPYPWWGMSTSHSDLAAASRPDPATATRHNPVASLRPDPAATTRNDPVVALQPHDPAASPRPEQAIAVPELRYPDLPISRRRADIAAAIRDHQAEGIAGRAGPA